MTAPQPQAAPQADSSPHPAWQRVLGTAGGVVLGVVFLLGLYSKVLDPEGFAETIRAEGLDFLLPAGAVAAVGLGLEAILGFALVLGLRRLRILLPSAALVLFFLFLTGRAYWKHTQGIVEENASCGCFGHLVERSPAEAFWQDLLLLVPPLLLAFLARPTRAAPHTRARFVTASALTGAALVFAWFAPDLPLDDLATRLKPGTEAGALCSGEGEGRICMDGVIPELGEGGHVVLLTRLEAPGFLERLESLNEYALDGLGPPIWVVVPATDDEVATFQLANQPAFEILPCPPGVLRPLYRRLPRTFRTADGRVTHTWQAWPALSDLASEGPADDDYEDDYDDDEPRGDDPDDPDGEDGPGPDDGK